MKTALAFFGFTFIVILPIFLAYYLSKPVKRWYPNIKINPPNKTSIKCNCGKQIIVMTNIYDKSNSGMGTCECGGVVRIN